MRRAKEGGMAYLRFYRRIPIIPGILYLNLSKSGVSITLGRRGLTITLGKRGLRTTVGVPGTGVSVSETWPKKRRR
ncbi:MAG: DUF4236 domain-containing protein [Zetaproteobacteria bacterium]|nr:MAG: DUF4236 domain-containing protein [Zetaproteobacteria bacterium]